MSKFSNLIIKWPKSIDKAENGGRLGFLRKNLPPPKRPTGFASAQGHLSIPNLPNRLSAPFYGDTVRCTFSQPPSIERAGKTTGGSSIGGGYEWWL